MPYAVTHMLIPMLILDLLRHKLPKIKKELPNRYVLFAGLGGLIPDIDIPISLLFPGLLVHRGITHTVWIPFVFLTIFLIFYSLRKHNLAKIFLMISIGTAFHVLLDFVTAGSIQLFYPLSQSYFEVNSISTLLPNFQVPFVYAGMDAILFFVWIFRMSIKRKVRDIF